MNRTRGPIVLTGTIVGTLLAMIFSLRYGFAPISVSQLFNILGHAVGVVSEPGGEPWMQPIIFDVRLPRIIVGAFVGGGLALCGAAMQGLFRNPLATPGVLGLSSGAAVGAVLAIYLGLAIQTIWAVPILGTTGAAITALIVYSIASRRGHTPIGTLLLAGIAFGSLNAAISSFVLSIAIRDYTIAREIMYWTLGGLDKSSWSYVKIIIPVVLLGSAFIIAYARDLDALLLGELHAASVGVDVKKTRFRIVIVTALITGAAVSVAGAVGFVGLIIPHMLRLVIGPSHRWLLPTSLFAGAGFLVLADIFARTAMESEEIRLGVITSALGAPFFLFLLLKQRKEGWW